MEIKTYDMIQIGRFVSKAHETLASINGDLLPALARHEAALMPSGSRELEIALQTAAEQITEWLDSHSIKIEGRE